MAHKMQAWEFAVIGDKVRHGSVIVRYNGNIVVSVDPLSNDHVLLNFKEFDENDFDPYEYVPNDTLLDVEYVTATGGANDDETR